MITIKEIAHIIQQRIPSSYEDALEYAHIVMDLFGFEDRIIDNVLAHSERQLFYLLEQNEILLTEREEIVLYNGKKWRIHYWLLNKSLIQNTDAYSGKTIEDAEEESAYEQKQTIYSHLPASVWNARNIVSR